MYCLPVVLALPRGDFGMQTTWVEGKRWRWMVPSAKPFLVGSCWRFCSHITGLFIPFTWKEGRCQSSRNDNTNVCDPLGKESVCKCCYCRWSLYTLLSRSRFAKIHSFVMELDSLARWGFELWLFSLLFPGVLQVQMHVVKECHFCYQFSFAYRDSDRLSQSCWVTCRIVPTGMAYVRYCGWSRLYS